MCSIGGAINVTATGGMVVGKGGTGQFTQSGGTATIGTVPNNRNLVVASDPNSVGQLAVQGGALTVNGNMFVGGNAGGVGGAGIFTMSPGSTVNITGTLKAWPGAPTTNLNIQGGTLTVGAADGGGVNSVFSWTGGTINVTGAGGLAIGGATGLGQAVTMGSAQVLNVTNATTINSGASLTFNGGTYTGTTLTGAGTVTFNSGNLTLSSGGMTIDTGALFGAAVNVPTGSVINVAGPISNNASINLSGGTIGRVGDQQHSSLLTRLRHPHRRGRRQQHRRHQRRRRNHGHQQDRGPHQPLAAQINLDAGRQLQLNGGDLQNDGVLDLDGGGIVNSNSGSRSSTTPTASSPAAAASPCRSPRTAPSPSPPESSPSPAFTNNGVMQVNGIAAHQCWWRGRD